MGGCSTSLCLRTPQPTSRQRPTFFRLTRSWYGCVGCARVGWGAATLRFDILLVGSQVYWNFFLDFGPLNLGQLYRFSQKLNAALANPRLQGKTIYFYSGTHPHRRTNAAALISSWAIIYLGLSPQDAYAPFRGVYPGFTPFHDATPITCSYGLTVSCNRLIKLRKSPILSVCSPNQSLLLPCLPSLVTGVRLSLRPGESNSLQVL
jgi:hypothetical protein